MVEQEVNASLGTLFACVCVCACGMLMSLHSCMHGAACGGQRHFLLSFSTLSFEAGFLTEPRAHRLAKMTGQ